MPELPDVHAFKSYLDSTSLHRRIETTRVLDTRILEGVSQRTLTTRLKGARFESSTRHGKFLFVELDTKGWLVMHFGMTGELYAFKNHYSEDAEVPRFTRLLIEFTDSRRLAYCNMRMLGRISLTDNRDEFIEAQQLGPDALDDDLSADDFLSRVSGRTGALKSILMNQSIVAGVGNEYADEILFQAGLHPATKVKDLDERALRRVFRIMRRVLRTACRPLARKDRFPRGYVLRRRDSDAACPKCGGRLRERTVSGRTSYYCPACQKKKRSS